MVSCAWQGWLWGAFGWKGDNFLMCYGASLGEGKGLKTTTKVINWDAKPGPFAQNKLLVAVASLL